MPPNIVENPAPGSGGLTVTEEMRRIIAKPGFLASGAHGQGDGQRLRVLYQDQSHAWNFQKLSSFGFLCYVGFLPKVMQLVESGNAPDLMGTETPYQWSYVSLVMNGAARSRGGPPGAGQHAGTLKYLLLRGAPPNVPDIAGLTALHHAATTPPPAAVVRVLLENGGDPNARNRYGEVPFMSAVQTAAVDVIELLMEFGADLDIPDADDLTPRQFFIRGGAKVAAAVQKWERKRTGQELPLRDINQCEGCRKTPAGDAKLRSCAKCRTVRYCSVECQKANWKTHKPTCVPFDAATTCTLVPNYEIAGAEMASTADFVRNHLNIPTASQPAASTSSTGTRFPRAGAAPKPLVIKVQVPFSGAMHERVPLSKEPLLIYTRRRDFLCTVIRADCPSAYDAISAVIYSKGVGGAKAYFPAELWSKDKLVVKIGEMLAEQPF